VKSSRFGPIELEDEAKLVGTSPQLAPALGGSTFRVRFFWSKKVPNLGSIPDPPGSNPQRRLFTLVQRLIRLIQGLWGGLGVLRGRGAKKVKSSRIGPIELGNEAKLVGTSPQLTPDLGWSTCEKKKFRPKKCPTLGSNLRHPDHKPWVRTRAHRLT
jgi:hypothetical protein